MAKEKANLARQEKDPCKGGYGSPMRKDNLAKGQKARKAGPKARHGASIADALVISQESALGARKGEPKEIGKVARPGSATSVGKGAT